MIKAAKGLITWLNALCLIENKALLAFKINVFAPLDIYTDLHILYVDHRQEALNYFFLTGPFSVKIMIFELSGLIDKPHLLQNSSTNILL